MARLEFHEVSVTFGSGRTTHKAVDRVSLSIAENEITGLVGESGSGKSTLAKAAVGLVKLAHGDITIDGVSITNSSARRKIQMVFQNPYASLDPRMSIGASIKEGLKVNPDATHDVKSLLDLVSIEPDRSGWLPKQFSGGQRQRIAIARALAAGPSFLIADEISSALDVSVQGSVLNLIKELQKELGFSVLFISHDLPVVRFMSDYIAVMRAGVVVERGSRDEVLLAPKHEYTKLLLAANPKPGTRIVGDELHGDLDGDRSSSHSSIE